jgi:hypothetical protein
MLLKEASFRLLVDIPQTNYWNAKALILEKQMLVDARMQALLLFFVY